MVVLPLVLVMYAESAVFVRIHFGVSAGKRAAAVAALPGVAGGDVACWGGGGLLRGVGAKVSGKLLHLLGAQAGRGRHERAADAGASGARAARERAADAGASGARAAHERGAHGGDLW